MEELYNGLLGHCQWDLLKEILFMAITYIIQQPEKNITNFIEETALCLWQKIIADHPSCVWNIAYKNRRVVRQNQRYLESTYPNPNPKESMALEILALLK